MVSIPGGGFALAGESGGDVSRFLCMRIDGGGDIEVANTYDIDRGYVYDEARYLARTDNGNLVLVGYSGNDYYSKRAVVVCVTPDGEERWRSIYRFPNYISHSFDSVVRDANDYIVACGYLRTSADSTHDGLVVKIEPERPYPQFVYYEPEDTVFTVLQGDTVDFLVRAHDAQGDELSYLWTVGDDTISRDTTATYCFEELGEYIVTCRVSDGEFTASINWRVTAVEFYIVDFRPDSTEMTIRRRSEVDFAVDVRALDYEGLGYYWNLVDRNGMCQEIGEEDSVRVRFDLSGDYDVEGVVWRGDRFDMAHWAVTVRSAIWNWFPDDVELSAPYDTTLRFEVIPFNPESDSLGYHWTLNGERLDVDTTASAVSVDFPFIGRETVRCLVTDGCEADSVTWTIDVYDPRGVDDSPADLQPRAFSLSSPSPNPFNAVTTIAYSLPAAGRVRLAVYDISGRTVGLLVDDDLSAGRYVCQFNGSDLAAGLYFIRLEAGGDVLTRKVVFIK